MSLCLTSVKNLYSSVMDGVIGGVREFFLDEGVDEQVLMELRQNWETRLKATKAVDIKPDKEPQPPQLKTQVQPVLPKPVLTKHLQTGQQPMTPLDLGNKNVSLQITIPSQGSTDGRPITIQVPASALQGNQLQSLLTGPVISATMALPHNVAATLLQQHVTSALQNAGYIPMPTQTVHTTSDGSNNAQAFTTQANSIRQMDGHNDTSDEEDDEADDDEEEVDDDDDDDADDKEDDENDENEGGAEEEPLNSGDDVSEEDPSELFDTDNVVVCQYDKITRTRNKWKFYLKDGIMNLGGKDYVFQKSSGDAEW